MSCYVFKRFYMVYSWLACHGLDMQSGFFLTLPGVHGLFGFGEAADWSRVGGVGPVGFCAQKICFSIFDVQKRNWKHMEQNGIDRTKNTASLTVWCTGGWRHYTWAHWRCTVAQATTSTWYLLVSKWVRVGDRRWPISLASELDTCVASVREAGGDMNWVLLGQTPRVSVTVSDCQWYPFLFHGYTVIHHKPVPYCLSTRALVHGWMGTGASYDSYGCLNLDYSEYSMKCAAIFRSCSWNACSFADPELLLF